MNNYKSTKIVATISDQRCEVPFLEQVFAAGVDVVRMNSAHLNHEGFAKIIGNVRSVSNRVAILMDTKGPEVRTTIIDKPVILTAGSKVRVKADPALPTTPDQISVNYPGFIQDVPIGASLLIDDGEIEIKIYDKSEDTLFGEVQNDGKLGARKSVNVPGVPINQPALTEKDKDSILYSIKHGVTFIAHSFVRSKEDVLEIQRILDEHNSPIKIIAKIENQQGVDNIDEILDVAYGVMIARGDLGIEIDMEKIPAIQAMIVHKCIVRKKPVIVSTQMLHTMIHNPRPTRAEVADVSSSIMMHTDAVMLSGETAYGKYPLEAVKTMARIIHEAELHKKEYAEPKLKRGEKDIVDITSFMAKYTVKSVEKLGVKAIINDTESGRTVRNLSAYRGKAPIFAFCNHEHVAHELSLSYGVYPFFFETLKGLSKRGYYIKALKKLLREEFLAEDDLVAYIGGTLAPELGTTSLDINRVKDAIDFYNEQDNDCQ